MPQTQETISILQQFLETCLAAVHKAELGTISREEAALEVSGCGIGSHLWYTRSEVESEGYQKVASVIGKEGCRAITEIIELALDLEVPKKHYRSDYDKDWDTLVVRIKRLGEMFAVEHNQKERDDRKK